MLCRTAALQVWATGKKRYGFQDLRCAFATMNAANMTVDGLPRQKRYTATQASIRAEAADEPGRGGIVRA